VTRPTRYAALLRGIDVDRAWPGLTAADRVGSEG
jgi:hypothetical protein